MLNNKNNIFIILNDHHSRAMISRVSIITKNKKNIFNPIFIGDMNENIFFNKQNEFSAFINFEEFNSNEKEIYPTNNKKFNFLNFIISSLKKFLKNILKNKIKETSLFSFLLQNAIYLRLRKKLKKAKVLINTYKPKLIITMSDRDNSDIGSVLLKAAKLRNIPIILINMNIFSKDVAVDYRKSLNELDTTKNKNLYDRLSLFFIRSCIYKGRLFQTREHLLAHKIFGTLSKDPWWNGNGLNDLIISSNGLDTNELVNNGVDRRKIVTIGNPEYEYIYKNLKKRHILRKEILNNYQFEIEKDLIIAAVPQWYEQGLVSLNDHFNEIQTYCKCLSKTNKNILLSLHPRQKLEDYKYLEGQNIKISKTPLSSIISNSDRYVSNISSTIIWSALIGIPTVVYDPFKIENGIFTKFKTVKICQTKKEFSDNIVNFNLNKKLISHDWKLLERSKVMKGNLSTKYIEVMKSII